MNRNRLSNFLLSSVVLAGAFCLAAAPSLAAEQAVILDPAASRVSFLLDATGHDVEGTLHMRSGELRFDPVSGSAQGRIEIDATAAETGNKRRDKTMHEDVLESVRFPLFVLEVTRIDGTLPSSGSADVKLVGSLALHGSDHPVTLSTRVTIDGGKVTASSDFEIPYVEWGLHDPSILFLRVAKVVGVHVEAHGTLSAAPAPATGD